MIFSGHYDFAAKCPAENGTSSIYPELDWKTIPVVGIDKPLVGWFCHWTICR
jgi:hypothetical protein